MAATARFCEALLKSSGALGTLLAHGSLSRVHPRAGGVGAWARGCSAIPFTGLLLHGVVLCSLSVAGLWVHPQFLVKKGQLLVELALVLRELIGSRPSLGIGSAVARSCLRFGAA
jgi:hypothetical protein